MWLEKKRRLIPPKNPEQVSPPPATPKLDNPMTDTTLKTSSSTQHNQNQTLLGGSVVLQGELSGNEDLLIEGRFEGTINVQDHCLTVGSQGQVKAEIHARQVVVYGSVDGKISARDKIDIRKTGHVVGDLVSAGVAIEEGAYFKGSIEILREANQEEPRAHSARSALSTSA